jgi:hypothetical protein
MADHAAWLLTQLSLPSDPIWVDQPMEEGSGFSKYVTYAVCTTTHSVRHRYSNFEKLQATLKARYGTYGLLVPSLPKKNVVLKGASFHFQRMRGLQIFCEKVSSNPYLRNDSAWKSFIDVGGQLEIERDATPKPPEMWMAAVDATETPTNSGELVANFKREAALAEATINALIVKAKAVTTNMLNLGMAIGDMASAAVAFSESETNEIDTLNSVSTKELNDGVHNSVPNVMSRSAQLLSSSMGSLTTTPDAINLLFIECLEYEGSQMYDFGLLAKHVDKIVADCDRNEKSLSTLMTKNTTKLTDAKLLAHTECIEHTEKLVEEGKVYLDKYIRALCKVTMPAVCTERKQRIKLLSLHLAAIMKASAAHNVAASDAFFDAMRVEDGGLDATQSGSMILESLSLPPLPEVANKKPAAASTGPRVGSNSVGGGARESAPPAPPSVDQQEV